MVHLRGICRPGLVLGAIAGAWSAAPAQVAKPGAIDGLVIDSMFVPIDGAAITILRTAVHVETGPSGRFRIQQVPPGQYLVIVRRLGFRPVSGVVDVTPGETLRLAYTMDRAVVNLDTTVVTERAISMKMAEFEMRRQLGGGGQFMTQEQIEEHNSVYATELIRMFHGIQVVSSVGGGGQMSYYAVSSRMSDSSGCKSQIFIDGVHTPPGNLDFLPSPKEIAGIEVYPGPATLPMQYRVTGDRCGVLLIWTREGGR